MGRVLKKAARLDPGARIGKYEVIRRLASGGMAELLLAKISGARGFQKLVALKRILPHLASNEEFVSMFLREARLAATLEHPNIVHVSDICESDGEFFLAMRYLEGRDLTAILKGSAAAGTRIPLALAIRIASEVAAGLHYAHHHTDDRGTPLGIVHRDVSPHNVFITYQGGIKLLDFGIAKAASGTKVTRVGVRKGKAQYMSPEQCRAEPLDARSDIFSLGIVLYELTTMRPLFRGDNEFVVMNQIVSTDAPPPSAFVEDYPEELEAILAKALARSRDDRYASAADFQRDLDAFTRSAGLFSSPGELGAMLTGLFGPAEPVWQVEQKQSSGPTPGVASTDQEWVLPPSPAFGVMDGPSSQTPVPPTDPLPSGTAPAIDPVFDPGETFQGPTPAVGGHGRTASIEEPGWTQMRSGSRIGIWLGAAAVLCGLAAAVAFWPGGSAPTPDDAMTPADNPTPASAGEVAKAAPATPDQREADLQRVNQADWDAALDYKARHAAIDRLRPDPMFAARIDMRLQRTLDLLQAAQSETPCRTFRGALEGIRAQPETYYKQALIRARVPTEADGAGQPPDESCEDLDAALQRLRDLWDPPTAVAEPAASDADPPPEKKPSSRAQKKRRDRDRPGRTPTPATEPAKPPPNPAEPTSPADPKPKRPKIEKLPSNGLRPLRPKK